MGNGDDNDGRIPSAGWTSVPNVTDAVTGRDEDEPDATKPSEPPVEDDGDGDLAEFDLRLESTSSHHIAEDDEPNPDERDWASWSAERIAVDPTDRATAEYEDPELAAALDSVKPGGSNPTAEVDAVRAYDRETAAAMAAPDQIDTVESEVDPDAADEGGGDADLARLPGSSSTSASASMDVPAFGRNPALASFRKGYNPTEDSPRPATTIDSELADVDPVPVGAEEAEAESADVGGHADPYGYETSADAGYLEAEVYAGSIEPVDADGGAVDQADELDDEPGETSAVAPDLDSSTDLDDVALAEAAGGGDDEPAEDDIPADVSRSASEDASRSASEDVSRSASEDISRSVSEDVSRSASASGEAAAFDDAPPPPIGVDPDEEAELAQRSAATPFGVEQVPVQITIPEIEGGLPDGEFTWVNQFDLFREEVLRLARSKRWRRLAAMTAYAAANAPYARGGTRTSLLLDLARIYRDRLKDVDLAEEAFAAAVADEPENAEAIGFLNDRMEERGDHKGIFQLYYRAVAATWDPDDRLEWTRRAAEVATDRMRDIALSTTAWEQLWSLGGADDEVGRRLARDYRVGRRWDDLARFLEGEVERAEGAAQTVLLRELAEVLLSGNDDPAGAAAALRRITDRNPHDPLVIHQLSRIYASTGDWAALEAIGLSAPAETTEAELRSRRHHVAETLWEAGEIERAARVYAELLAADAFDDLARERTQEHLRASGRFEELLTSILERADTVADDDAAAELLFMAAEVAVESLDDAPSGIEILERRRALVGDDAPTLTQLADLYGRVGNDAGVAEMLERVQRLEDDPDRRLNILRSLAAHYASQDGDEAKAEECWKEILAIDANDATAREQLMELHRGRGDFEALNSALMRQIVLTTDDGEARRLSTLAAQNLDEHFDDVERSIEAWRRVLDYAPDDAEALQALSRHYQASNDVRGQIAVLEERMLGADAAERAAAALEVGRLWTEAGAPRAAAAAYERVLHWDPSNAAALDGLVDTYVGAGRNDWAVAAVDQALGSAGDADTRAALLRRSITLLPDDAHAERISRLRRLHLANRDDGAVLEELEAACAAADAWEAYASVLGTAMADATDDEARRAAAERLAVVLDERLQSPDRAYVTLQAALWQPAEDVDPAEVLGSLSERTGRHEDLLALLNTRTWASSPSEGRADAVRARAEILGGKAGNAERAFEELRRLVELDPRDEDALAALETLAEEHDLWAPFTDVLRLVADGAADDAGRGAVSARIEAVARIGLEDQALAFFEVVRQFRLDPFDSTTFERLCSGARTAGEWEWVLPVLEAARLAELPASADAVARVAALYAESGQDNQRAFDLYQLAFAVDPESEDVPNRLAELADEVDGYDEYAHAIRRAAARCEDDDRAVELLRRTASVYEQNLERPEDAVDIHRRLLELRADELPSLEVMIGSHREREQWHDLRDRLSRWIEVAPEDADRKERLLEIGRISEENLGDVHRALDAYGRVLAIDADDETARARTEALVHHLDDPRLRLGFLRSELARAPESGRTALEVEIATLLRDRLDDAEGAIEMLAEVVERDGVGSDAFEPLVELLSAAGRDRERAKLLVARAYADPDDAARVAALRDALDEAVRCDGLEPSEREEIYRSLLEAEPEDVGLHRQYAQLLRSEERFEDLAALLEQTAEVVEDATERDEVVRERARLLYCNLGERDQAVALWTELLSLDAGDEPTRLALAFASLDAGDVDDYVARRRELARELPAEEGALVLCHLAEASDEVEQASARPADFYREARHFDPNCEPAKAALKAIGRRKKDLRPEAALLPESGERDLSWSERGARLRALGAAALETDVAVALDWFRRAVATDANDVAAWDALADAYERVQDSDSAFRARANALEAIRRSRPLSQASADDEATRLLAIAEAALAVGSDEEYERIIRRVHSIAPGHAPTALAVAELMLDRDEVGDAQLLIDGLLSRHVDRIPASLLADVYYVRGRARELGGRSAEAMDDYRVALKHRTLFADALARYAELLSAEDRYGAAIEHLIRALVVEDDAPTRANLLFELGVCWEDGIGDVDEAGACYEFARSEGLDTRELMLRVFRHFQRTGQLQEGLDVVDGLLESAADASELARLWMARGEIFATHSGREDDAIEAFDMALSYDPDLNEVRAALASVLERRGDWDQLLQILEAIAESDAGTPAQRADAFVRMARIAIEQLDDTARAEEYLNASIEAEPSADAVALLSGIVGERAFGSEEHRALLGRLTTLGPPWYEHCLRLGQTFLADDPRLAWCLLSPALVIRSSDDELKGQLRDMRREHERPPLLVPAADQRAGVSDERHVALRAVFAELNEALTVGCTSLDELGAEGLTAVSVHSNIGRTFSSFAEAIDVDGCTLFRADDIPEAVTVVNREEGPAVVIRTDVFQQLARAEIGFMLAYATELASPGSLPMAATAPSGRTALVRALWAALGFADAKGDAAALADRIREEVSEGQRDAWAERLGELGESDAADVADTYWRSTREHALRLGLLAGADLFQAARLVARMETDLDRPNVFEDCTAFDDYVAGVPGLASLVAFAASPEFAKLFWGAAEI